MTKGISISQRGLLDKITELMNIRRDKYPTPAVGQTALPVFDIPIQDLYQWDISCAGNSTDTLSPGTGFKIKILYGLLKIVCDATVITRYMRISVRDGSGADIYAGS